MAELDADSLLLVHAENALTSGPFPRLGVRGVGHVPLSTQQVRRNLKRKMIVRVVGHAPLATYYHNRVAITNGKK